MHSWKREVVCCEWYSKSWAVFEVDLQRRSLWGVSMPYRGQDLARIQLVEVEYVCVRVGRAYHFALRLCIAVLVIASLAVGRCCAPEWRCSTGMSH